MITTVLLCIISTVSMEFNDFNEKATGNDTYTLPALLSNSLFSKSKQVRQSSLIPSLLFFDF